MIRWPPPETSLESRAYTLQENVMERPIIWNVFRILKAHDLIAAVALWSLQAIVTIARTVDVIEYYNASYRLHHI